MECLNVPSHSSDVANPEATRQDLELYRKAIEEQMQNRKSPSKIGRLYDWFCENVEKVDVVVALIPDGVAIYGVKVKVRWYV